MKTSEYFNFERKRPRIEPAPEEIIGVKGPIMELAPSGSYRIEDFDIYDELKSGPLIEVAGPTEDGFDFVDIEKLPGKIFVSNLYPGTPRFKTGNMIGYYGLVDFRGDGRSLPVKEGSVGAIFLSCLGRTRGKDGESETEKYRLNKELRENVMEEAYKVLKPGGILVFEKTKREDFEFATRLGFELKQYKVKKFFNTDSWSFVFQKQKKH